MKAKKRIDFCIECRAQREYVIKEEIRTREIEGEEYSYSTFVAYCVKCKKEMSIPGLLNYEIKKLDEQYRLKEDIISVKEIERLIKLYGVKQDFVDKVLGFETGTIERYRKGQMPSKKHSQLMKQNLKEQKAWNGLSEKMRMTISYMFQENKKITPLALQKLLYYIQGIFLAQFHEPLFLEECEAWAHGPVYPEVYSIFKEYKYHAIKTERFVTFAESKQKLSEEEKQIINLVMTTFGKYSGRALEKLTHQESPWIEARRGVNTMEASNFPITKASMEHYFMKIGKEDETSNTLAVSMEERIVKKMNNYITRSLETYYSESCMK